MLNLKNFKVISVTTKPDTATMTFDPKRIKIFKTTVEALGYPEHVRMMIDPKEKGFAIQVCEKTDENAIEFSKPSGEQKIAVFIHNPIILETLRSMMDWNDNTRYQIQGTCVPAEKGVIFDLTTAEPLQPRNHGGGRPKKIK